MVRKRADAAAILPDRGIRVKVRVVTFRHANGWSWHPATCRAPGRVGLDEGASRRRANSSTFNSPGSGILARSSAAISTATWESVATRSRPAPMQDQIGPHGAFPSHETIASSGFNSGGVLQK